MTGQQLKNSILQLAIQGKLVPQIESEGTAEDLLKEIRAEKERLVKEGKLKKKDLEVKPIEEDEVPFEIPEGWRWCRLGEIGIFERGSGIKRDETFESGFPCVRYGEMYTIYRYSTTFSETRSYTTKNVFDKCRKAHNGDIFMALTGENKEEIALASLYVGKEEIAVGGDLCHFTPFKMDASYLVYFINSPFAIKSKRDLATGDIIVHISTDKLSNILFPLPPIAEQRRIVEKIEELMPLVEEYGKAQERLEALNKELPEKLKKSVLQEAIMGKLVPQDPSEGTAEELLAEIRKEKEKLVKEGKLKKKDLEVKPIEDDEIPFEIPEGWRWCRWGDLSFSIQYGYNAPAQTSGSIKMVRISDIHENKVSWETVPYCEISDSEIENYKLQVDDILFARTGGTVGKSFLVTEINEDAVYAGYLIRTRFSKSICPKYAKLFMETVTYWEQLREGTIATAQPNCNGQTLSKMKIPIPPFAEQKRIVAKLEEVMEEIEGMKK